jgi:hypothetical protein
MRFLQARHRARLKGEDLTYPQYLAGRSERTDRARKEG